LSGIKGLKYRSVKEYLRVIKTLVEQLTLQIMYTLDPKEKLKIQ
jgi:hypothetical protein